MEGEGGAPRGKANTVVRQWSRRGGALENVIMTSQLRLPTVLESEEEDARDTY